ncbi:hypothetical protein FOXB_03407, partial [Fusarium oxysporum f. sp. conglutinans Fo5176]
MISTWNSDPEDLLPARGIATGALTLPPGEAIQRGYISARQQRLLRTLAGEKTPEQPSLTMPFAREGHRIRAAMSQDQVAFRMEQVVTIRPSKLERGHRHFFSVLHPIFQLMRFFLKEKRAYTTVLRSFLPSVFPTILCSFAKLFELGLAEMHRRFLARAEKGLDLALSEAVAVLDRLGNYCFTGDTRVLMTTIFRPLLTMDSLKLCAWPRLTCSTFEARAERWMSFGGLGVKTKSASRYYCTSRHWSITTAGLSQPTATVGYGSASSGRRISGTSKAPIRSW